jgi:hypothetical protein
MRMIGMTLAVMIGLYGVWWGYQTVLSVTHSYFGVQNVTLSYDTIFRKELPTNLEEWFADAKESGRLKTQSRNELATQLLKDFPLIERVSWAMYVPGQLRCHLTGVTPTFVINDKHIAGSNGRLYKHSDFTGYEERIPSLHVAKDWLTPGVFSSVHRFFGRMPRELFSTYNISYHDPYTIALVPVEDEVQPHSCICIVDEQSANRLPSLQELMTLAADLKVRNKTIEDDGCVCLFDFRFENRIISKCISRADRAQLQRVA